MTNHRPLLPAGCAALALGLLALAGCGQTPPPRTADESLARMTLDQALAAWQQGQTVEAMKHASPPIHVSDPSWQKGETLKKFDAVLFFTTGNPLNQDEIKDLVSWVKAGGVVAGAAPAAAFGFGAACRVRS